MNFLWPRRRKKEQLSGHLTAGAWQDQLNPPPEPDPAPGIPFDPHSPDMPLPRLPTPQPPPVYGSNYPPPEPIPQQEAAAPARRRLQLPRRWMAVITAIGMVLTVLVFIDGLGFIHSGTVRDIVAVLIAAFTPLVVYFIPDWRPPTKGGPDASAPAKPPD